MEPHRSLTQRRGFLGRLGAVALAARCRSSNRDGEDWGLSGSRKTATKKLKLQKKRAYKRSVFGSKARPADVTIRTLDGEVLDIKSDAAVRGLPLKFVPKKERGKRKNDFAPRLNHGARDAGYASYADFLASSYWRRLRTRVLERDHHRCAECGSVERLVVHHLTYERLGRERLGDLVALCDGCHRRSHRRAR